MGNLPTLFLYDSIPDYRDSLHDLYDDRRELMTVPTDRDKFKTRLDSCLWFISEIRRLYEDGTINETIASYYIGDLLLAENSLDDIHTALTGSDQ